MTPLATTELYATGGTVPLHTINHSTQTVPRLRLQTDGTDLTFEVTPTKVITVNEVVFTPYTTLTANSHAIDVNHASGDISHAFSRAFPTGTSPDVQEYEFTGIAATWRLKVTTKPKIVAPIVENP